MSCAQSSELAMPMYSVSVPWSPLLAPPIHCPQMFASVPSGSSTAVPSRESTFDDDEDSSQEFQGNVGSFSDLNCWSVGKMREGTWTEERDAERSFGAVQTGVSLAVGTIGAPSRGSTQHGVGRCKPCAFVHRPTGCAGGVECKFCHLCEPGEKKLRQKQKHEAVRLHKLARQAKVAQNGDSCICMDSS